VSKKKNKRNRSKNPNLDPSLNLKARRDSIDNHHYIRGVKNSEGIMVMPALDERCKAFLNSFNAEYYNADFSAAETIHTTMIDNDTLQDVKAQIKTVKANRKRIFGKSPNTTNDEDREMAAHYTQQIDDMEYFLDHMFPKRAAEFANNHRNMDLLNYAKRSNKYNVVSWDELREDELNDLISDFSDIAEKDFDDD